MLKNIVCILCCFLLQGKLVAQNIPLGTWRFHSSGEDILLLRSYQNTLLAATTNTIYSINEEDNSIQSLNKVNALSDVGITALQFNPSNGDFWVGYANGNLDIISQNRVNNFNLLVNPSGVLGSPAIRDIYFLNNAAYLATSYGVIVMDVNLRNVRFSWRNIGQGGQQLAIRQITTLRDSIYLATEDGILAGKLSDNLQDFNNWNRFNTGDLNNPISALVTFNDKLYAAINNRGVFKYTGTSWVRQTEIPIQTTYAALRKGNNQLIVQGNATGLFNPQNNGFENFDTGTIGTLRNIVFHANTWWITNGQTGLFKQINNQWQKITINGMASSFVFQSFSNDNVTYAVHGGYQSNFTAISSPLAISKFENGTWTTTTTQLRFASVAKKTGELVLVGSFGDGLEILQPNSSQIFNSGNSTLQRVTDFAFSSKGTWIANYNATESIQLLNTDNTLTPFTPGNVTRLTTKIVVDDFENLWLVQSENASNGVAILNSNSELIRTMSDANGSLPDRRVYAAAVDKEGLVWLGTGQGACYFSDVQGQAVRPIVEGRFLLSDERVNAIAIDGGNRKWFGTQRGLWLFNEEGDEALANFTTDNAPLPSNIIRNLSWDEVSGELFIATDAGLVSFRTDASKGEEQAKSIKIFPNPVQPEFIGLVGITQLVNQASVKIITADGKLIKQLNANGGTAAWDLTNFKNEKVKSGVYFVLTASGDGVEKKAGKIIVVR